MINPLVSYPLIQPKTEGCGCDEKKKEKKVEMIPQGKTPMGGDVAVLGRMPRDMSNPWVRRKLYLSS